MSWVTRARSRGSIAVAVLFAARVAAADPAPIIETPLARLELRASQHGLTYYRSAGTAKGVGIAGVGIGDGAHPVLVETTVHTFERLCTAPCATELPPGTYRLGLSLSDGPVIGTEQAFDLRGRLQLDGTFQSRANTRAVGWALLIGGALLGTVLALHEEERCTGAGFCHHEHPALVPGLVIFGAGTITGLVMTMARDEAVVSAKPLP